MNQGRKLSDYQTCRYYRLTFTMNGNKIYHVLDYFEIILNKK